MKEKHSKPGAWSALKQYPLVLLFFAFLFGMILADCLMPDRKSSELENTSLQQRPTLSITAADITGGKAAKKLNAFFTGYSEYVKAQVAGRDGWINLQSRCETLLFQKTDYGNVLLGKEHMEFARTFGMTAAEQTNLPKNIAAVAALGNRYPGRVSLMLVPSAATIYPENVPLAAPLLDEDTAIASVYSQLGDSVDPMDVRATLSAHKDEYIYYRTDHHWTTDGAYYAYAALCTSLGLTPCERPAPAKLVSPFYGTNYSKCRQWNAMEDTISLYDFDSQLTVYKITGASSFEPAAVTGLYDESKLDVYDKYAAFLYGNNGYSRLSGSGTGNILLIKDSYANCFAPFLTENYANVDVVDLRNYNYGLDGLIQANDYDAIVVLYSYASFKGDANLYKAGVAG